MHAACKHTSGRGAHPSLCTAAPGGQFASEWLIQPWLVYDTAAHSAAPAGTGNGQMVRVLRKYGKSAWGIELSDAVLKQECPDLLEAGIVESGVLTNLPYADNSFDMVVSADVLEHIHPDEAEQVISELVRVSRRHLFLSISLKGHTKVSAGDNAEANRHTMLRPRSWWERRFQAHGARVNTELMWAMQQRDASYGPEDLSDCRLEGDEEAGGNYQVRDCARMGAVQDLGPLRCMPAGGCLCCQEWGACLAITTWPRGSTVMRPFCQLDPDLAVLATTASGLAAAPRVG